jgi:hypothetical protein
MKISFAGADTNRLNDLMLAVNEYLQFPVLPEPEQREILLPKFWQWLIQRKADEKPHKSCISAVSTITKLSECFTELHDQKDLQLDIMDFTTECTIHAAQNYDAVFTLPYIPDPDWAMPAEEAMKQLLIEHSAALGRDIFLVHQVRGVSYDEQITDVVNIVDRMYEVKAKMKAKQTGLKMPESKRTN